MKHLLLLAFALALSPLAHAGWTNNRPALSVLGKPSFTADLPLGPTATAFDDIEGVAVDPKTGKLFIADNGNNRVLRYSSAAAYLSGTAAEAVFGQTDFVSASTGTTANTLDDPAGIHVDSAGRLWVADDDNNRVLRFDNASNKPTGASADGVLGQSLFTTDSSGAGAAGMNAPSGVFADPQGRLWVVDSGNHRVLRFDGAAAKPNGGSADRVLGQADFTGSSSNRGGAVAANTLSSPWGLSVDASGRLWVGDAGNNRVLRFNNAAGKANGANADGVLGQVNFTDNSAQPTSAAALSSPYYVTAAPDGIVWVGDYSNRRVLGFKNGASKPNGGAADIVLGQPNFTGSANLGPTSRSVEGSSQIAPGKDGSIFVGDYRLHRVVRFSPDVELKAPARANARKGRVTIRGTSAYASEVRYRVVGSKGFRKTAGPPSKWRAVVRGLKRPVTRIRFEAVAFDNRKAVKTAVVRLKKS
jgi:sugar lactone lactonase YvrE